MADSPETKSIKELTKKIEDDNKKTQDKLERTVNLEVASKDEIKELKKKLKAATVHPASSAMHDVEIGASNNSGA